MDYEPYKGLIIERLLKITDKVPQLREIAWRIIRKAQAELDRKFEGKYRKIFKKENLYDIMINQP